MLLHWVSLLIFFGLGVLALWVANSLLEKNGLYFFSIVASIVSAYFTRVELINRQFSVQLVVLPVIFLALFMAYSKYGKKESIRLFHIVLFSQITMFVLRFFEFAFLDLFDEIITHLTWEFLRDYVATILAFAISCVAGYFFIENVKLEKILRIFRVDIYMALLCAINTLIFVVTAYPGFVSFVDLLVVLSLSLAFSLLMALLLACFEWLLNLVETKNKGNANNQNKANNNASTSKGIGSNSNTNKSNENKKGLFGLFNKDKNKKEDKNKKDNKNLSSSNKVSSSSSNNKPSTNSTKPVTTTTKPNSTFSKPSTTTQTKSSLSNNKPLNSANKNTSVSKTHFNSTTKK